MMIRQPNLGARAWPALDAGPRAYNAAPGAGGPAEPLTVLVADEDALSATRLARMLEAEDFVVRVAVDAAEAAAHVLRGEADIAVIDVALQLDAGRSLVAHVKSWAPSVPLIAVSADPSWETSRRIRIEDGPVFYYALKPVEPSEIREALLCAAAVCRRARAQPV